MCVPGAQLAVKPPFVTEPSVMSLTIKKLLMPGISMEPKEVDISLRSWLDARDLPPEYTCTMFVPDSMSKELI